MEFVPTQIPDVVLIQPRIFEDERGFVLESYQKERFSAAGIHADFVQDNHSASSKGEAERLALSGLSAAGEVGAGGRWRGL